MTASAENRRVALITSCWATPTPAFFSIKLWGILHRRHDVIEDDLSKIRWKDASMGNFRLIHPPTLTSGSLSQTAFFTAPSWETPPRYSSARQDIRLLQQVLGILQDLLPAERTQQTSEGWRTSGGSIPVSSISSWMSKPRAKILGLDPHTFGPLLDTCTCKPAIPKLKTITGSGKPRSTGKMMTVWYPHLKYPPLPSSFSGNKTSGYLNSLHLPN